MRDIEFDNVDKVEENHFWFRNKRRIVSYFFNKYYKGGLILDSGCGTGRDLKDLKNSIAMDYNFYALKYARKYCDKLVNGDANFLPFKDKTFEIIFSFDLLQHKGIDFDRVLKEYNRVLKKDGYIFLNLPMFDFLYSKHDLAVDNSIRFERKDLKKFKNYGFSTEDKIYWNFVLFPLIVFLRKFIFQFFSYDEISDVKKMGKLTNLLLDKIFSFEFVLSLKNIFPLGLSCFIVLRKEVDL